MLPTSGYKPWTMVPAEGLTDTLRSFVWQRSGDESPAAGTAALMLYIVMLMIQVNRPFRTSPFGMEVERTERLAKATYDEFSHATGLSRSLIRQGLSRLVQASLINPSGSKHNRCYLLKDELGKRWFKLPCRAVISKGEIPAFKTFSLRTRHELNALKLYLYLADVRDRRHAYSEATYETINKRTGISERDIRRAINLLISSGLIAQVQRDHDKDNSTWGANKYYLKGYEDLMLQRAAAPSE